MIKITKGIFTGNIKVESNNFLLNEIEEKALEYLEKGHEIVKPLKVRGINYSIVFSAKTNYNSNYLQLKRALKQLRESCEIASRGLK